MLRACASENTSDHMSSSMNPSSARRYAGWGGALLVTLLSACGQPDPEQAAAYAVRGDRAVEQNKFREATIDYLNAVQHAPDDTAIRWKLVQASLHAADYDRTLAELRSLLQREPGHAATRLLLGRLYLTAAKPDEAAHMAKELVATCPDHPAGYLLQGELAVQVGELTKALDRFEQAHERDAAAGDRDMGEREFDRALELGRDSEPARLSPVVQHLAHGRQERARLELEDVIRTLGSNKGRALLAELLLETGRTEEGRVVIGGLPGKAAPDAVTLYLQGRLAMVEQRWSEARTFLSRAMAMQEAKAGPPLWLGRLELLEGHDAKGEALLEQAVRLDPDNPAGHLALAGLYFQQERYDRAAGESLEVLRRNPGHLEAALMYGDAHAGRGRWTEAQLVYQAICTQLPEHPIGYRRLGQLARRQGLTAKAVTWYAQAVAHASDDVEVWMDYVSAMVAAEQGSRADQLVNAAVRERPQDPRRWEIAARHHRTRGRLGEARAAWQRVNELLPDAAGPYYELAQLDVAQQKPHDSEAHLRQALAKDGQSEEVLTEYTAR